MTSLQVKSQLVEISYRKASSVSVFAEKFEVKVVGGVAVYSMDLTYNLRPYAKGNFRDDAEDFLKHKDTLNDVNVMSNHLFNNTIKFRKSHPNLESVLQLKFSEDLIHPYSVKLNGASGSVKFVVSTFPAVSQ